MSFWLLLRRWAVSLRVAGGADCAACFQPDPVTGWPRYLCSVTCCRAWDAKRRL